MERKEGENSDMELCEGEKDDMENVEMPSEVSATRTVEPRQDVDKQPATTGRTRKPNSRNREEVEAEEIHRLRRSLSGYLSRVSTSISQLKTFSPNGGNLRGFVEV